MNEYYGIPTNDNDWRLYHHGIKGQKWGTRNGPPYPLKPGARSAKEQKLNGGGRRGGKERYGSTVATIAVATAGVALTEGIRAGVISAANKHSDKKGGYKERAEARDSLEKDDKTGFALKKKKMTIEQDAAAVNPDYKNGGYGATNNCMHCTVSYDLRRRGYDVEATKIISRGKPSEYLKRIYKNPTETKTEFPEGEFPHSPRNQRPEVKERQQQYIANTKENIAKQGNGARGNICVMWEGGMSGHSMAYEVKNGKPIIIDAQVNKIYKGDDVDKLLSRTMSSKVIRTDNLELNKTKELKRVAR